MRRIILMVLAIFSVFMMSCSSCSLFAHKVYFKVTDTGSCSTSSWIEYTVNGSSYTVYPSLPWTSPTYTAKAGSSVSIFCCEGCNNNTNMYIYRDGNVLVSANDTYNCGITLDGTI